jgi:hypothetical protein
MLSIDFVPCLRCPVEHRCDAEVLSTICPVIEKWVSKQQITKNDFRELQDLISPPPPASPPPPIVSSENEIVENIGIESMKREREIQAEFYGNSFHSSAHFTKEREEAIRQRHRKGMQNRQRFPMSNEQKQKISSAIKETLRNKKGE